MSRKDTDLPQVDSRKIKQLPEDERPREKLLRAGPESLTDSELLAILLRTGVQGCNVTELARRFVTALGERSLAALRTYDYESLIGFIRAHSSKDDPTSLRGIGSDKLATLLAALEIGTRVYRPDRKELQKPFLRAAQVAELVFSESTRFAREGFWALYLNHRRIPICAPTLITLGVGTQTLIDPQTLFRKAVMLDARAVILIHNHPTGDVTPSEPDISTTQTLIEAGKTLSIPILDHVIVGNPSLSPSYYSIRASGRCSF